MAGDSSMPNVVWFIFAFIAVLALIVGFAWALRRFGGHRLGANANRGRMPRLAVMPPRSTVAGASCWSAATMSNTS